MSTDFQTGRVALGARLRELRTEAGLNGKDLAERLGWQRSKVSRLENGKQTPSVADLTAWSEAVHRLDVAAELVARLKALETQYRSWRRQLSHGHRTRQELAIAETAGTRTIRGLEVARIPGLFQTAEYARHLFTINSEFRQTPRDADDAVRGRIQRQEALYEPGYASCRTRRTVRAVSGAGRGGGDRRLEQRGDDGAGRALSGGGSGQLVRWARAVVSGLRAAPATASVAVRRGRGGGRGRYFLRLVNEGWESVGRALSRRGLRSWAA